jgi:hypothetical protein
MHCDYFFQYTLVSEKGSLPPFSNQFFQLLIAKGGTDYDDPVIIN